MPYQIISGSTHGLVDTDYFINSIDQSVSSLPAHWRDLFNAKRELIVTRAPGRIDLMGGIGDYSGSLVLQLPIQIATHVALQRSEDTLLRIVSLPVAAEEPLRLFEIDLRRLPIDYADARSFFASDSGNQWAAYVAGAFVVLMREAKFSLDEGARILIQSTIPEGKGVSSSAALEVAVMQAVAAAYGIEMSPQEVALLCQKVENLFVGAPCGVMDQMTAVFGETNCVLELLCQPAELKGMLALPEQLEVWAIDSGIRHFLGGSDYRTVRAATFMGYRIIAAIAGLSVRRAEHHGHVCIDDWKWKGYLANVTPEEFEQKYAAHVPERLLGREFLDRYQGITDVVTCVDPAAEYPVRQATRHPIYEHARVNAFASMLKDWRGFEQTAALGELMFRSHGSYSACGLGSPGTDELVRLVKRSRAAGLYGARITGGGNGGAVAILGRRGAINAVQQIAKQYRQQMGSQPAIISDSSPGASLFGHLRLMRN
jgi:galactokinase